LIVPMPPSKAQRPYQPVLEIASALGIALHIPLDASLKKAKSTPQIKDIGDFAQRVAALEGAFVVAPGVSGKQVLLVDDLLQSGATMNTVAKTLKTQGL
jgi:competence protein ComFC